MEESRSYDIDEALAHAPSARPFTCDAADWLYKARPYSEGDDRYLYIEPSTEHWDNEGEQVPQRALRAQGPDFLKFGHIDIGHMSMPEIARKLGIEHPELKRVGHPVEIKYEPTVCVKAALYRGESKAAEEANILWERLQLRPPARYYPSVGGKILGKSCADGKCVLEPIIWRNIGLWEEPVNHMVKAVSTIPFASFVKAALTAGHATDSASLSGGAALRRESLDPKIKRTIQGGDVGGDESRYLKAALSYLRGKGCPHRSDKPTRDLLKAHFRDCGGMDEAQAGRAADRFNSEIHQAVRMKKANPDVREAA
jgi:hypothetical protein